MKIKYHTLILIIPIIFFSCENFKTEKFNQDAYDDYLLKSSLNNSCILGDKNTFYIDMNIPNFDFYIDDKKLDFNTLENLDTFISNNKVYLNDYRFSLVGQQNIKNSRIDSIISVLQKHERFRYQLIYQRGFWEK